MCAHKQVNSYQFNIAREQRTKFKNCIRHIVIQLMAALERNDTSLQLTVKKG